VKSLDIYSTSLPSSLSSIGKAVDEFISNLQKSCDVVDDCTLYELRVILNEVLINAIRHGNGEDASKVVKVDASISGQGTVFIIVEDEGCGYDYNNICNCRKPLQGMPDPLDIGESGRGIMIVRSLCDNVKVNAKGNKIVLTKKITGI
jgi:serine/threonine-protein kinase RsbW